MDQGTENCAIGIKAVLPVGGQLFLWNGFSDENANALEWDVPKENSCPGRHIFQVRCVFLLT